MIEQLLLYFNVLVEYILFFYVFFSPMKRENINHKALKIIVSIASFAFIF